MVTRKATKNVYFSGKHVQVMTSYHAKRRNVFHPSTTWQIIWRQLNSLKFQARYDLRI